MGYLGLKFLTSKTINISRNFYIFWYPYIVPLRITQNCVYPTRIDEPVSLTATCSQFLDLGPNVRPLPLHCHIIYNDTSPFSSVVYFYPLYYVLVLVLRT